ncbi:MAG: prepilin-type N-terminal cleavage/methylation domain-containing protein [Gloeocapsa sp. DLM2.Bin57]|nr:MAG: prepilin-type N-terminal cleavage/methylation domain-containing protein [Gloeocapsa sp. DLM2.Bin57]
MKSDLQFKLLSRLNNKKQESGFTLIELLVVVIIIGVLAAVALPNLLRQVGKARETEIKNAVGTLNRSQQAYHFERQEFAPTLELLGITIPNEYISNVENDALIVANDADSADAIPANDNYDNDGTRAYVGRIEHAAGEYSQLMCQSDAPAASLPALGNTDDCPDGSTQVR